MALQVSAGVLRSLHNRLSASHCWLTQTLTAGQQVKVHQNDILNVQSVQNTAAGVHMHVCRLDPDCAPA